MTKSFKSKKARHGLPMTVILTALKVEFKAVVAHLKNRFEEVGDQGTVYECGDLDVPGGQSWKVAVVECGAGNQRAASEVHLAINYYKPDVVLFVGVAGSLKKDVRLGDVVASTKVYCYHSGKSASDFHTRPELALPSYALEQRSRATARNDRWLRRLDNSQLNSETLPEAHIGPIAAGEQVVSDTNSPIFKLIRDSYNDALGVEMEGYGTLYAASRYGINTIVIRGISDPIDDKSESDAEGWQQIASQNASAFAFEMLATFLFPLSSSLASAPEIQPGDVDSSTTRAVGHSSEYIEWVVTLDGVPKDLNPNQIRTIEESLRDLSQDQDLRIKKIEAGSIAIRIESSQEGFQKVNRLYTKGILHKISELPIKIIYSQDQYLRLGEITASFGRVSQGLLNWPTTLDGEKWLTRKELGRIDAIIRTQRSSAIVVLGSPGSGKSALLAKIGMQYSSQGIPVLAIKADKLDVGVKSLRDLGRFLELPDDPVSCVRLLAQNQTVLVILDQLDALADLVDLHSQRLNILLDFIYKLLERENIHLVCSCREFEYRHDVRLNSIQADVITLTLPDWDEVANVLSQRNINAAKWPQRFREILLTPQHLKIFLELLKGSNELRIFKSYQAMLESLWRQRVTNRKGLSGRSELLTEMAVIMGDEETLWLPTVRFEDRLDIIEHLEAEGILICSEQGRSVSFRHQTLFDYARARAFAKGQGSLSEFVLARQDALFVRPKLWSSLIYLRGVDPRTYKREFEKLWNHNDLRLHIGFLLIEFLGQIEDPDEQEAKWLLYYLDMPKFREKVLLAIAGNKRWFELISKSHLPVLMGQPTEDAWNVSIVLGKAWPFARERNLELIKKYWLPDKSKDLLVWRTMESLEVWDEDSVLMVCKLIGRSEIPDHSVMSLANTVSASAPGFAPRIVVAALNRELTTVVESSDVEQESPPENASEEELFAWEITHDPREPFENLVRGSTPWYYLPELADAAPRAFLETLWPWFLDVLNRISYEPDPFVTGYCPQSGLATMMATDEDPHREYPLVSSIELAITKLAENDPSRFLEFLEQWQSTDLLTVQRLLARGLIKIAASHSTECLSFLIDDPRRLVLGEYQNEHSDSIALISTVVPHLSNSQIGQLEKAVMVWNRYQEIPDDGDAQLKRSRLKYNREHRLPLLKAFPPQSLSQEAQKIIREEERALPNYRDLDRSGGSVGTIGSPMSSEQMGKAKDEHILNLFNELNDSTEWNHPRHFMQGGSIQASRAFADFAKKYPERAIRLIAKMLPGCQERPVGYAIEALSEADYPLNDLFELIVDLDRRGFKNEEFRINAASALGKRAKKDEGLPDKICSLFERWLSEPWKFEKGETDEDKTKEKSTKEDDKEDSKADSILWGYGGIEVIPRGTYTILETLTRAYLLKRPMKTDRWLRLLKSHLDRSESSKVWRTLSRQLRLLVHCDHDQAIDFLKALFKKYPEVRDSENGAILIANVQSWVPDEVVKEFLYSIRDGGWRDGPQAYAEILLLRRVYSPDEEWSRREVEELLNNRSTNSNHIARMRLGLAYSAAHLWDNPKSRRLATDVLVKLIPLADKTISHAIMDVFRVTDSLYSDEETRRFLETLVRYPNVLKNAEKDFLVDRIQDLLPADPELVFRVCKIIVDILGDELVDMRTSFSASAPDLVNISLTLQRYEGEQRRQGLELFERLLELNVYGARDALVELDSRPVNTSTMPRRRRRKKR